MGLTTENVVVAAGQLADEAGLDAVSMSMLAAELGVRVPSLYKHVAGLDDLHRRMAAVAMSALDAALHRSAEGRRGRDALVSLAQAYRRFARVHPGQYRVLLRGPGPAEEHVAPAERTVALLTRITRDYRISGDDAVHAVRGIRAALHGFVSLESVGGYGASTAVEASFYSMVAMLDRGLASWAQPGKSSGGLLGTLLRPIR